VQSKKLSGISGAMDLTDRTHGLRLVIEIKTGFNPEAVLEQLYRHTPLEESFSINNVALVDGQPRTLGLRELLVVWVDHRLDVIRRRSRFRLGKRLDRLHLVEGLLIAILDIDEVIQLIRTSDDADVARIRLRDVFDLSDAQAEYILELRLRRLTKFQRIELEKEQEQLRAEIAELQAILADDVRLRKVVSDDMADVAATFGTPRRTILLESAGGATVTGATPSARTAAPLEIADTPCWALLSATGLLARTSGEDSPFRTEAGGRRSRHDVLRGAIATTARGDIGVVTSRGRIVRVPVLDLPSLPPTDGAPTLSGGVPLAEVVALDHGEQVVGIASLAPDAPTLALGTAQGTVKRVAASDAPPAKDAWEVITLKDGDEVVGAAGVTDDDELVLVSADASLLHFAASAVRPQGRAAGGMAGIKLADGQRVVFFGAVSPGADTAVVTVAGTAAALPGTQAGTAKTTPFELYPGKSRATGGVRAHRFLKGEDTLILAWVGQAPPHATGSGGQPIELPAPDQRRDGSGVPLPAPVHAVG
jgi:DNA gyrase subunit A